MLCGLSHRFENHHYNASSENLRKSIKEVLWLGEAAGHMYSTK